MKVASRRSNGDLFDYRMSGGGRVLSDAVQYNRSWSSGGESAVHDPKLPIPVVDLLPGISPTADVASEAWFVGTYPAATSARAELAHSDVRLSG